MTRHSFPLRLQQWNKPPFHTQNLFTLNPKSLDLHTKELAYSLRNITCAEILARSGLVEWQSTKENRSKPTCQVLDTGWHVTRSLAARARPSRTVGLVIAGDRLSSQLRRPTSSSQSTATAASPYHASLAPTKATVTPRDPVKLPNHFSLPLPHCSSVPLLAGVPNPAGEHGPVTADHHRPIPFTHSIVATPWSSPASPIELYHLQLAEIRASADCCRRSMWSSDSDRDVHLDVTIVLFRPGQTLPRSSTAAGKPLRPDLRRRPLFQREEGLWVREDRSLGGFLRTLWLM